MTKGSYNSRINAYRADSIAGNENKHQPSHRGRNWLVFMLALIAAGAITYAFSTHGGAEVYSSAPTQLRSVSSKPIVVNECSGNTLAVNVVVVLSEQHLWACDYNHSLYNSPVITGYSGNASNITPVGTYHIYDKLTHITLTGSDDLGPWNDPVSYWMGWLYNKYGQYGLHDATWRTPQDFGHISPTSKNASHGCVELPLATAKWLYSWVSVGSTLTIKAS